MKFSYRSHNDIEVQRRITSANFSTRLMQDKIGNLNLLGNVCSRLLSFAGLKNDISRSMTGTQKQNCKDRNCRKLSDVVLGCFVLMP